MSFKRLVRKEEVTIMIKEDKIQYRTVIYARLSIQDNGIESDSMEHQLYFLKKYVSENTQLNLIACYCDNGRTGTTFERPAFCAMLEEVKKGKIDCIVVRDLSRFGRNYIETGIYLETIFPLFGVRFISVQDHYDTNNTTERDSLTFDLKNVCHHFYAKDISKKIGTVLEVKRKQGCFIGNTAPFGYKKSKKNHYQLEIEEETAAVVREIFNLRMSGMGVGKIAKILNDKKILSKNRRRYELREVKGTNGEKNALWSGASVLGILQNPVYCGHLVERKGNLPKEKWNLIKCTHEAIIDEVLFSQVQHFIEDSRKEKREKNKNRKTENIFRGILFCGECQGRMVRSNGYFCKNNPLPRYYYYCRRKYIKQNVCCNRNMLEEDLSLAVIKSLKIQFFVVSKERLEYNKGQKQDQDQNQKKRILWQTKTLKLYQTYKQGKLSKKEYCSKKENLKEDFKVKQKEGSKLKEECLSKMLCQVLVKRIIIYQKYIEIHYSFCSEFHGMCPVSR